MNIKKAFHLVDYLRCCVKAFPSDAVPLVNFCFCCLCFWCHIQNTTAKTKVKGVFLDVFFHIWFQVFKSLIHFCEWCKGPISFFCMWMSSFSNTIDWRDYLSPLCILGSLCQMLVADLCGFIWRFFILFHWSMHLFLY